MYAILSAFCFGLALYGIGDGELLVMTAGVMGAWFFGIQVARY